MNATEVTHGDAIRFKPINGRNRITVLVESVERKPDIVIYIGVRLNRNGHIDSQSRRKAWAVWRSDDVEKVD